LSFATHPVFARLPGAFTQRLGYPVLVAPGGQAEREVRAIVRAPFAELAGRSGDSAPGVKGRRVPASFIEADVPGLRNGDAVRAEAGGPVWRVREPEPDGRGMVRCELERG
jgi:hypothetical protein